MLRDQHAAAVLAILLGTWLAVGGVIRGAVASRPPAPDPQRQIPVRFSGSLGRYEVRTRGDGRRAEVRTRDIVLAELIARDDGDELVVDFSIADQPDVDAFGAAIGLAMEMVVAADDDVAPRQESGGRLPSASTRDYPRGTILQRLRQAQ
jgi:hypothetical protein